MSLRKLVTLLAVTTAAGVVGGVEILDPVAVDKFYQYGYQVEDTHTGRLRIRPDPGPGA